MTKFNSTEEFLDAIRNNFQDGTYDVKHLEISWWFLSLGSIEETLRDIDGMSRNLEIGDPRYRGGREVLKGMRWLIAQIKIDAEHPTVGDIPTPETIHAIDSMWETYLEIMGNNTEESESKEDKDMNNRNNTWVDICNAVSAGSLVYIAKRAESNKKKNGKYSAVDLLQVVLAGVTVGRSMAITMANFPESRTAKMGFKLVEANKKIWNKIVRR